MGCSWCRALSCFICLLFIVILPEVIILITLSFVGLEPRIYIQELYVPALNNTSSMPINKSIFIDLKLQRVHTKDPLRYEDINITLFYGSNRSFSVGNLIVPGFYQGQKKTVHRKAVVKALGLPWEDAFHNISSGSMVALTVELATKYKLEVCDGYDCDYTDRKAVVVAVDLQLDASGRKLSKKALRLH